jgi:hypothetical protein
MLASANTMTSAMGMAGPVPPFANPTPDVVLRSPLVANHGGFGVYANVPDAETFNALLAESLRAYTSAVHQESWAADQEEGRGGKPPRRFLTSQAGPVQDSLYEAPTVHQFLSSVCGLPIAPSGNRGSYSYYARPGDFLDLHRDVETCDVAMITALHDNSDPADPGGALMLYPGRLGEPLSAIRSRPNDGACVVKLFPGQTIVMFGGLVPHRVLPVVAGQVRIISVLCFRAQC